MGKVIKKFLVILFFE